VGSTDISDAVRRIEVWQKATEGLGRFEVTILNKNGAYVNAFSSDSTVTTTVDNAVLMNGYLDQNIPQISHTTQVALIEYLLLKGRDYGQDSQNKMYVKVYNDKADNVIADMISNSGTEMTYTSDNSAPTVYYNAQGNCLLDDFRAILELVDYDGFVDKDKVWNMFPHDGSANHPDSGITLKCVAEDLTNNVVKVVDHAENDSVDLKNYIIALGPDITDGWTELNATDWTAVNSGNTVSDYTATSPTTPRAGVAAIKADRGTNPSNVGCKLTFPRYFYNYIDWSGITSDILKFQNFQHYTGSSTTITMRVYLTDTSDNKIHKDYNSVYPGNDVWNTYNYPIGYMEIDAWTFDVGSSFTWLVKEIEFDMYKTGTIDWFLIDALNIPNAQLIGCSYDNSSISLYKKRKLVLQRNDLGTFKELQAYADSILVKRKNPIERLNVWARGDAGLIGGAWKWLPGYQTSVNIPALDLNKKFRFVEIHHIIERYVEYGFNHLVELQLVPAAAPLETLQWSYGSLAVAESNVAQVRALRDRLKRLEQQSIGVSNWYAGLP
jgi:hypothetical protein